MNYFTTCVLASQVKTADIDMEQGTIIVVGHCHDEQNARVLFLWVSESKKKMNRNSVKALAVPES